VFAHDVPIRRFAEAENTVVRWPDEDRGGHFAALEEPETLTTDTREFFRGLRGSPIPRVRNAAGPFTCALLRRDAQTSTSSRSRAGRRT
jgi:hypothetical protein